MRPRLSALFRRDENVSERVTSPNPRDVTKTGLYIFCDLGMRLASAVALVFLGIAGWRLQQRAQQTHDESAVYEQQERRYLPMLRTLLELELVLERSARAIRQVQGHQRSIDIDYVAGVDLQAAAYSLFAPPHEEPWVKIHTPGEDPMLTSGERNKVVPMHLRDAALMYSEILMRKDFIDKLPLNATAKLDRASKAILIQRPKEQKEQYHPMFYLTDAALVAWCA